MTYFCCLPRCHVLFCYKSQVMVFKSFDWHISNFHSHLLLFVDGLRVYINLNVILIVSSISFFNIRFISVVIFLWISEIDFLAFHRLLSEYLVQKTMLILFSSAVCFHIIELLVLLVLLCFQLIYYGFKKLTKYTKISFMNWQKK